MNIKETIRSVKPNITDSTLASYNQNLTKIARTLEKKDLDFLENYDMVVKAISHLSPLTQRNYYNSIIVYLQAVKGDEKAIAKYVAIRDVENDAYQAFTKTNTKSKKQEKNWITEEELNDVLEYQKSFDIQKYTLLKLYDAIPIEERHEGYATYDLWKIYENERGR